MCGCVCGGGVWWQVVVTSGMCGNVYFFVVVYRGEGLAEVTCDSMWCRVLWCGVEGCVVVWRWGVV